MSPLPGDVPRPPVMARWCRIAVLVELAVAAALRGRMLSRPLDVLDRLAVPDDTYYTLTIARSLAAGRGPTVDGHTLTSGFQPLIAFLMTPVFWLTHDPDVALRVNIALLLGFDVLIVALLAHLAHQWFGPAAAVVAAGLWAVSPMALVMAVAGLETTLAMACELGLLVVTLAAFRQPSLPRHAAVGAVAALAILARIDAVMLVVPVAAVLIWRTPAAVRVRLVSVSAAAGALVLAPWWGYCLLRLGTPIPGSGDAARALQADPTPFGRESLASTGSSAITGPFGPWTSQRVRIIEGLAWWPFASVVTASLVIAAAALLPRLTTGSDGAAPPRVAGRNMMGAFALFVVSLMAFYAWYDVRYFNYRYLALVAPAVTLAIAAALGPLFESGVRSLRTRRFSRPALRSGLAGLAGLALLAWAGPSAITATTQLLTSDREYAGLPHPTDSPLGYRAQAVAIDRVLPRDVVVGANQSGALGYYAGEKRTVVNLDGVVNPGAASALRHGRLPSYARRRGIRYLVDWPLAQLQFGARAQDEGTPLRTVRVVGVPSARLPALEAIRLAWPGEALPLTVLPDPPKRP